MLLNTYLKDITPLSISEALSGEADVRPTLSPDEVEDDNLLFCIPRIGGEYSFEKTAITREPFALVADNNYDTDGIRCPVIRVENVRLAMAYAFYRHYYADKRQLKLIGITGTNGKTTTATLIYKLLNDSGIKCGMIGTGIIKSSEHTLSGSDYSMTTPDPELLYPSLSAFADDGCDAVVMEVSSHALALEKLAPLKFDYAIFTNLSREHMDFHPDMDDYFKTKLKLFASSSVGIFNTDDEYGERAYGLSNNRKLSVGIISDADCRATDISFRGLFGSSFLFHYKGIISRITTHLPGSFNVYNLMSAIITASELGIPPLKIQQAITSIKGIEGRMEIIKHSPTVIIDYAHTPKAFENTLKTLNTNKIPEQNVIVVFGCGGNRDKSKRPAMAIVANRYADQIIITEDNSRNETPEFIFSDITAGLSEGANYAIIPKREEAIRFALSCASDNDIVAIIGKGHERYIIDADGYRDFDERQIVEDFYKGVDK